VADLVEHTCGECGCVWGFPKALKDQRLEDGKLFYCPNGHGRQFTRGQSESDKLRRERDQLKQRIAYKDDMLREAEQRAKHERHRANGYKGHATRITKRAKAGVCPCCNRTFQQLARHMAAKHPTFTPMELDDRPPDGATVQ
jgi:hypothetical protein